MDQQSKIPPAIVATGHQAVRQLRGLAKRSGATFMRVRSRLSRPVRADMPSVWTMQMTRLVVVAVCLTAFAAIFDPYFRPLGGPPPTTALAFLRGITDAAKSGVYIVAAVIVIAIIGLLDWRDVRHGTRRALVTAYGQAAFILAAVAVPGITANIIKQFVGRARPRMVEEFGVYGFAPFRFDSSFQSFPSGHATTAGSLAMILILWHPEWKWPLLAGMALLGSARIAAGAHYPSDVVAGFALGAIMTLVFARWLARRRAVFVFDQSRTLPRLIR